MDYTYTGMQVKNKKTGNIGVILNISDSGIITVIEKITPYVICTHDNWNTLEIIK